MHTVICLRLRDGRSIPFGSAQERDSAELMRVNLLGWLAKGSTLTIANAKGELEDITPHRVLAIDLVDPMTEATGLPRPSAPRESR